MPIHIHAAHVVTVYIDGSDAITLAEDDVVPFTDLDGSLASQCIHFVDPLDLVVPVVVAWSVDKSHVAGCADGQSVCPAESREIGLVVDQNIDRDAIVASEQRTDVACHLRGQVEITFLAREEHPVAIVHLTHQSVALDAIGIGA